jgi:protein-disulfide isomerase/uncharacterized membrane protein
MENNQKSLTMNGITGTNFLFIINALVMMGVSVYLTSHFYEVRFPTSLGGPKSLCDISNFFNCDTATFSSISNIAGIPISYFGIVVGMLFSIAALMPSLALEKTASAVSKINFIGCVALFLYSLIVLGSLCPFCTAYYALSGIAAFLLWKYGVNTWKLDMKTTALWGVILLAGAGVFYSTSAKKTADQEKMSDSIVGQYRSLPNLGEPDQESPYKIHMATEKWEDAPLRLVVFSDFECPFCKIVSEQLPDFVRRYGNKINIQYMFYPLDNKCNANMEHPMHRNACDAAAVAACDEKKFAEVHDEIFANQAKLGEGALNDIMKKHNLTNCIDNPDLKNKIITTINQGTKYNLKSTPTIILNGKKIEGSIPSPQFFAIMDDILANQGK